MSGILASAISGWLAISILMRYVSKHSYGIFAFYRVVLGIAVLAGGLIAFGEARGEREESLEIEAEGLTPPADWLALARARVTACRSAFAARARSRPRTIRSTSSTASRWPAASAT